MGWSADALKNGTYVKTDTDPEARRVFANAVEQCRKLGGGVDLFLDDGGVHLSACRRILRQAVGRDVNGEVLTPDDVVELNAQCNWPEPSTIDSDDLPAYWSIRLLLETCVKMQYGLEVNI